jgi:hypothetical protein
MVAEIWGQKGNPHQCISELLGKADGSFFL